MNCFVSQSSIVQCGSTYKYDCNDSFHSFSQNISIHSFLQSIIQDVNYCNVFIVPKIIEATKIMFVIFTLLYKCKRALLHN